MRNFVAYCLCVLAVMYTASAIRWKDCGSKDSKVSSVSVTGCEKTPTCALPKGHNATVTVSFDTTLKGFTKATAVVHGIIGGLPVPFPIPHSDGCSNCGLSCPVKKATQNKYFTNIYIQKSYPDIRVVVKWELKDEKSNDIFCIELPAEVVNA